jgi:hypothetical protein
MARATTTNPKPPSAAERVLLVEERRAKTIAEMASRWNCSTELAEFLLDLQERIETLERHDHSHED